MRRAPCSSTAGPISIDRQSRMTVLPRQAQAAAVAETTTATATTTAKPPKTRVSVSVRPFISDGADARAVAHMCRDVYGGTDYMPRVIGHLGELSAAKAGDDGEQQRTIVLVAEEEEDDDGANDSADNVDAPPQPQQPQPQAVGVVVAQLRGEGHAFLFGLRVDPRARGKGIGRALMRAACDAAARAGARHLVGATIPSNDASIALFRGTGHEEHARVDVWPPFPLLADYERAVGFRPPPGQRPGGQEEEEGARYHHHDGDGGGEASPLPKVRLLDHLPGGVRGVLMGAAAASNKNKAEPRRCSCVDELARALAEVRAAAADGDKDDSTPLLLPQWVPAMYEVMPARGPWARERAREGGAWLLPSDDDGCEAVVVAGHSLEARRFVVGVVAADGDAAARALLLAEGLAPSGHFLAFVDAPVGGGGTKRRRRGGGVAAAGEKEEEEGDAKASAGGCALSRLYALTRVPETHPEGRGCMIVYHRSAHASLPQ